MAKKASPLDKEVVALVRHLLDVAPDALGALTALQAKHAKKAGALKIALEERAVMGVAAMRGEVEVVESLVRFGVDPNVFPRFDMNFVQIFDYPLVVACKTQPEPEAEERVLAAIRAMLDAGASVDTVGPPRERVKTDQRYTALDVAIAAGARRIVELLMTRATLPTREAALVAAVLPSRSHRFDRTWLMEFARTAPIGRTTWMGLHVLHAAIVRADEELWSLLAARTGELNVTVLADTHLSGDFFPLFRTGFYEPMQLRAGATLLDVAGLVKGRLSSVAAQYEEARRRSEVVDEVLRARLVARLESTGRIEVLLREAGVSVGVAVELPEAVRGIEVALLRLLNSLGTAERWNRPPVDVTEMGPLGFLMAVAQHASPLFAGASSAHLLGQLLKGELSARPVLYGPELQEDVGREEAETMTVAGNSLVVWPKDYPAKARTALETAILGERDGEVIAATREPEGTSLWAITTSTVRPLGGVQAFVDEGVNALIAAR